MAIVWGCLILRYFAAGVLGLFLCVVYIWVRWRWRALLFASTVLFSRWRWVSVSASPCPARFCGCSACCWPLLVPRQPLQRLWLPGASPVRCISIQRFLCACPVAAAPHLLQRVVVRPVRRRHCGRGECACCSAALCDSPRGSASRRAALPRRATCLPSFLHFLSTSPPEQVLNIGLGADAHIIAFECVRDRLRWGQGSREAGRLPPTTNAALQRQLIALLHHPPPPPPIRPPSTGGARKTCTRCHVTRRVSWACRRCSGVCASPSSPFLRQTCPPCWRWWVCCDQGFSVPKGNCWRWGGSTGCLPAVCWLPPAIDHRSLRVCLARTSPPPAAPLLPRCPCRWSCMAWAPVPPWSLPSPSSSRCDLSWQKGGGGGGGGGARAGSRSVRCLRHHHTETLPQQKLPPVPPRLPPTPPTHPPHT